MAVVIVGALYFGREVVIPFALAVLLSFLLSQPVNWLESIKLGRVLSVAIVLTVALSIGGLLIYIGAQQLAGIIVRLPMYQQNIQQKVGRLRNPAGFGLAKAEESIKRITDELSSVRAQNVTGGAPPKPTKSKPVPVQVVKQDSPVEGVIGNISAFVMHLVATMAAVALLTLFMLLRRADLRNRLFRLFGEGRINAVTVAMDDAAHRVSRYLLTQSIVNSTFGLLLGTGLYFLGLPFAAFWGVLAAILRFIPYLGTWTAGACPFLLSLAVFDGWFRPVIVLAIFGAIEFTTSGLVEPWIYATRTGISSLAILVSAAFWTMLWGPVGLIVSTPLSVLLFVLGRHVPHLEFLWVILGDEPVLPPDACYYQRLLSGDEDEARDVVSRFLAEHLPVELCDAVLIPALAMAEQDRHRDELDDDRQKFILETTRSIVEDTLGELAAATQKGSTAAAVVCVPARDQGDELVALILSHLLRAAGYRARLVPLDFVEQMLREVNRSDADVVLISALPPSAIAHARSLCRRTRQSLPDSKTIIGLWGSPALDPEVVRQRLGAECAEFVVHTAADAELQLRLFGFNSNANVERIDTADSLA